jgi:hypothetical protein
LFAACKKSNSDAPAAPLQAKLNGKLIRVTNLLTNPDIQYNNIKLLGAYGAIDGDTSNAFSLTVAYQDIAKGETVDLATDNYGKAFISYQMGGTGDIYGAGYGWGGSSGKVTVTSNNLQQRKIEGTFSCVLVNGNNTSQTIPVTEGHFSFSY